MRTPWTSSRSSPVKTSDDARRIALAAVVSMAVIFAWANGLRTIGEVQHARAA